MAHVGFGNTWWGERWLDALADVDFDNRLPRGKRYARNGSVLELDRKGTEFRARVQGSRSQPYKIKISLNRFSRKDKAAVLQAMTENPVVLSQLLARKLPPALLESFQKRKVPLFPSSWLDLSAFCSCPDWADCCKHIAAVIYLIANEVDRNPFLLFEIHGLDVFAALEGLGYLAEDHVATIVAGAYDRILDEPEPPARPLTREERDERLDDLDLSQIPFCRDLLLSLLTGKPLFYPSNDFKHLLEKALKSFAWQNAKVVRLWAGEDDDVAARRILTGARVSLDPGLRLTELVLHDLEGAVHSLSSAPAPRPMPQPDEGLHLFRLLFAIPRKDAHRHDGKVVVLSLLTHLAVKLIEQGAIRPEILAVKDGYRIRWLPALISPPVQKIFDFICELSTVELFTTPCLPRADQVMAVLSGILGQFIGHYASRVGECSSGEIPAVFFAGQLLPKSRAVSSQSDPELVALWLSQFHIATKRYVPLIEIQDTQAGFALSVAVEDREADMALPIPLNKILTLKKYVSVRFGILKDLILLSEHLPDIADYLASGGKAALVYAPQDFERVLFQHLPVLRLLRIPVLMPKGLARLIRPRLSATISGQSASEPLKGYLSLTDMLRFQWQVAIGDRLVPVAEFQKIVRGLSGIVRLKDHYVYLDQREIEKLLEDLKSGPNLDGPEILRAALSEEYDGSRLYFDQAARKAIDAIRETEPCPVPEGLAANLRDYQRRGFEWLVKNAALGFGSLIADDMGLGKTVQVLAVLLFLQDQGRLTQSAALVVVPTTLLTNWKREAERFAPGLRVDVYHGGKRSLDPGTSDVVLTTYSLVRRDGAVLHKHRWSVVILDEAQNIKNHGNAQTKAVKKLKSELRIAMTGTPVENRLSEYWSIFDFLNRGYLKTEKAFRTEFAIPVEVERDRAKLDLFRKTTSPFVLRRLKTDRSIIRDLPDKLEFDQLCQLTKEQAALYQSVTDQTMTAVEQAEGIERRGLVLKLITSLKQICNHPAHYLKKTAIDAEGSGKTALLLELLGTIHDNGEKVLIFTQYTEMGRLLQSLIKQVFSIEAPFLHGGVARRKRDDLVDGFQSEPYVTFMLLSLKAGGTGLNLTAANNVIHFDLWWNPAVEAQATDRAYRIGQQSDVMVHRLITGGTFEEKIDDMIKDKKELADFAVASGEKWIGDLGNEDLRGLFTLQ